MFRGGGANADGRNPMMDEEGEGGGVSRSVVVDVVRSSFFFPASPPCWNIHSAFSFCVCAGCSWMMRPEEKGGERERGRREEKKISTPPIFARVQSIFNSYFYTSYKERMNADSCFYLSII